MHFFTTIKAIGSRASMLLILLFSVCFTVSGQEKTAYSITDIIGDFQAYNQPGPFYLVVGDFTSWHDASVNRVAVLNSSLDLVSNFKSGTGLNGPAYATLNLGNNFLVAGNFTTYNDTLVNRIVLLKSNGSISKSFKAGTGPNGAVRAIAKNGDKYIIAGDFTSYNGKSVNHIARLNTDGTLDESFNLDGEGANGSIQTVLEYNGKFYVGGDFTSYNGTAINRIARLNTIGTLDNGFDPGSGANGTVYAIEMNGNLLIGGAFTTFNGLDRNHFASVKTDGTVISSYNPDPSSMKTVRAITVRYGQVLIGGDFGYASIGENGIVGFRNGSFSGIESTDVIYDLDGYGTYGVMAAGSFGAKSVEPPFTINFNSVSPAVARPGDKVTVRFTYNGFYNSQTFFEVIFRNGNNSSIMATTVPGAPLKEEIEVNLPGEMANGVYTITVEARNPDVSDRSVNPAGDLTVAPTEWTGAKTADFGNAENWTLGLPNVNTDVIIKTAARFPKLSTGTFNARNFLINQGASFTLATGGTLNVRKNFTNNGVFIHENGILTVGSIGGSSLTQLNNFTVSTTGTELAGDVAIAGVLTLKGDLKTNNNRLMLLSDETGTAYVKNEGGEVIGEASMERYIENQFNVGPGYRHFASPVENTTVGDLAAGNYAPTVNPAYNSASNPYTIKPFPTIFGYDQSRLASTNATTSAFDFGWYSPSSLSSSLEPGKGYSVNIPASAKVTLSGQLNSGNIKISGLGNQGIGAASGWHLLGNPYPSPIDWEKLTLSGGIDNAIYVYRSSGQYIGTYAAFVNGVGDADARYVAPMQGFFVHASSNGQSLTFTDEARVYNVETAMYRTGPDLRPQLQLNLKNSGNLSDELYVYFQESISGQVDGKYDAFKVLTYNFDRPTLFARLGQEPLSIKGLPLNNALQTLPLEFYVPANGTYIFSVAEMANFSSSAQVQLIDLEKNVTYDLSKGKEISVALTTTTSPTRFVLRFASVSNNPLGAGEEVKGLQVQVFPNPSKGDTNLMLSGLKSSTEKVLVNLFNSYGQQVLSKTYKGGEAESGVKVGTSTLAAGVYHLQITTEGKTITKKIVLQK
ncbi:T9SS type A sorting domain-containing protein [Rufibacter aurantiacus]|uniref:T9SS type A sorting domain-containing protein n=1 Tax=Rufibacter aurantiacus TaxID=2817374 RepID=UPI001B311B5D|nr:T9SS type A sorting domain-containing protein [Rufibacter aurantiacus]